MPRDPAPAFVGPRHARRPVRRLWPVGQHVHTATESSRRGNRSLSFLPSRSVVASSYHLTISTPLVQLTEEEKEAQRLKDEEFERQFEEMMAKGNAQQEARQREINENKEKAAKAKAAAKAGN